MLLSSTTTSPLLSIVSAVEEINVVINSFPPVLDLVSVAKDARSAWYLDAPPVSPASPPSNPPTSNPTPSGPPPSNPPPLDLPTCVPLAWPPLSDFSYLATGAYNQVSGTGLVVWDGVSSSSTFPGWFTSIINGHPLGPIWYFAALVASGVGFWLAYRLVVVAISEQSTDTSTKVRGLPTFLTGVMILTPVVPRIGWDPPKNHPWTAPKSQPSVPLVDQVHFPDNFCVGVFPSDETPVIGLSPSAPFTPPAERVSTCKFPRRLSLQTIS